jgi:tyrosyl-tRNA synthetase
MYHDAMPGTAEHLAQHAPVSGYIGFDPTAASLHIGNLATIMLLVHLQRAGHRPVALVGGATGMIGDPSGKSAERNLLDETTLRANQAGIRAQLERFLQFNDSPTGAVLVNNYDWFKEFSFLGFLREVGKHLTVNYMMSKESVKRRIGGSEEGSSGGSEGISYTEFSYQLLQGYDFFHLYKELNCTLQMGASDQCGKSETGTVWLDPALTSPYQFYQFFLRAEDADAPRLIRVFTLLSQPEIEALEAEHAQAPHLRVLQKALAKDVTIRVHSEAAYEAAVAASQVLFGGGDLASLDEPTLLDVFAGEPQLTISAAQLAESDVITLLSEATGNQVFSSKGEARKMVQNGGLSINREKVSNPQQPAAELPLLLSKYLVVKKGKKHYLLKLS